MRQIITALLLVAGLATTASAQPVEEATPAVAIAVPSEPGTVLVVSAVAVETGSEGTAAPAAAEETKTDSGILDKVLAILRSVEAIVAGVIAFLVATGYGVSLHKKLTKFSGALDGVIHKIEEHKANGHKKAAANIAKSVSESHPKDSPVGAIIHASAKRAQAKIKNGG